MCDQRPGKSLSEVLSEINGKTMIYLGAASSFFDIAAAEEMRHEEYVEELSLRLEKFALIKAETSKKRFMAALKNPPAWNDGEEIDRYVGTMETYSKWLKSLRQAMKKTADYAKNLVPLGKRIVKSVYPKSDGTGACVIVEGNEVGGYWLLSEKESGGEMVTQDDAA